MKKMVKTNLKNKHFGLNKGGQKDIRISNHGCVACRKASLPAFLAISILAPDRILPTSLGFAKNATILQSRSGPGQGY